MYTSSKSYRIVKMEENSMNFMLSLYLRGQISGMLINM